MGFRNNNHTFEIVSGLKHSIALLSTGSAILLFPLFSCDGNKEAEPINEDTVISQTVDSMTLVDIKNGKKNSVLVTPKMEDYGFATVPFTEYRMGIEFITYNDSTGMVSSHITSDYALHWTDRDLWELKGNVVVEGENDRTLYTQQLMWNVKTEKIYSNVDSKVEEGEDVFIGEGFEADSDFRNWTFRRLKGRVGVDVEPSQPEVPVNDSLAVSRPGSAAAGTPGTLGTTQSATGIPETSPLISAGAQGAASPLIPAGAQGSASPRAVVSATDLVATGNTNSETP